MKLPDVTQLANIVVNRAEYDLLLDALACLGERNVAALHHGYIDTERHADLQHPVQSLIYQIYEYGSAAGFTSNTGERHDWWS